MTAPLFEFPERVPQIAVERLLRNFDKLVRAVQAALAEADAESVAATRWRKAQTLLEEEYATLQSEAEAFEAEQREPLLRHASALRLLTRRMDGYALNFAGDEAAKTLAHCRHLLVLNAWQIAAAASGSEAPGL